MRISDTFVHSDPISLFLELGSGPAYGALMRGDVTGRRLAARRGKSDRAPTAPEREIRPCPDHSWVGRRAVSRQLLRRIVLGVRGPNLVGWGRGHGCLGGRNDPA